MEGAGDGAGDDENPSFDTPAVLVEDEDGPQLIHEDVGKRGLAELEPMEWELAELWTFAGTAASELAEGAGAEVAPHCRQAPGHPTALPQQGKCRGGACMGVAGVIMVDDE